MRTQLAFVPSAISVKVGDDMEACSDSERAALGVFSRLAKKWRILKRTRDLLEMGREPIGDFPVTKIMQGFIPWDPLKGITGPRDLDRPLRMISDGIVFFALTLVRWRGLEETIRLLKLLQEYKKEEFEIVKGVLKKHITFESFLLAPLWSVMGNGR